MRLTKHLRILAAFAAFTAGFGSVGSVHAAETVKVGVLLAVSGPAAPFGIPERDTVQVLADKYNASAGPNGRKLELIFHDTQTNPTEAARGATKLIQQDKVQVIIGPTTGSSALAMMPIAAANSIPVLAPVGTIAVTQQPSFFPWIFRACPNDEMLVRGSMEKGIFKPGYKRIAVMFQEDAYGKGSSQLAEKLAKEKGVEVVAMVGAETKSIDLTSAATNIRNAKPDAVLLWTSSPGMAAAFVRAANQVGLHVPVIGSGALTQRSFITAAAGASDNVMLISLANWDDPSPKLKALDKVLRAAGKTPSGFGELLASAAMVALTEGLKKVEGQVTGQKLRDALESLGEFDNPYVDGQLTYNSTNHEGFGTDALLPLMIRDGKFKTVVSK